MSMIFWLELLGWVRFPPLLLFLIQYKGEPWAPIALMLRGSVVMFLWQGAVALIALSRSVSIAPLALKLTFGTNVGIGLWAYLFYTQFLRSRKADPQQVRR